VDRLVAARGLAGLVSFPGHLDDAAFAAALGDHHVLAVPSAYEGFGIVYLEAMGFGVVPIASSAGGGAEIVEQGKSGYLVAPDDARGIARALEILAGDRGLLRAMAHEARHRYGAFPGWKRSMASAVSYLHALAADFPRRGGA
jgi:glycosyltransferase involved in cell wall biosynthesis